MFRIVTDVKIIMVILLIIASMTIATAFDFGIKTDCENELNQENDVTLFIINSIINNKL